MVLMQTRIRLEKKNIYICICDNNDLEDSYDYNYIIDDTDTNNGLGCTQAGEHKTEHIFLFYLF